MKVPTPTLSQIISLAAPLIAQGGSKNPFLETLGNALTGLAGQHGADPAIAPAKQELSAALSTAISQRRAAAQSARDRIAGRK